MGLGWEIANVFSPYLQKTVADMSNKEREAGVVAIDFSKFSEAQLKKVAKALGKSQGSFLLKQALIKHRKDTWTMPNADTPSRKISSKPMNNVISRILSRATVSKARLLVTRNNGAPVSGLSPPSLP